MMSSKDPLTAGGMATVAGYKPAMTHSELSSTPLCNACMHPFPLSLCGFPSLTASLLALTLVPATTNQLQSLWGPINQSSSASYTQLSYASLTPLISPFTPPAPPLTLAGRCCPQTPGGSCSRASVKGGCILTLARSHARAQTSAVIHTRRRHSGVQASAH